MGKIRNFSKLDNSLIQLEQEKKLREGRGQRMRSDKSLNDKTRFRNYFEFSSINEIHL